MDPGLAKTLRDDKAREFALWRKANIPKTYGGPLTAAEEEEQSILRTRIAETTKALKCPVGYGALEARKDTRRLDKLFSKRETPRAHLTDAEDAEEAQLTARVEAFKQTPEGLARDRIHKLRCERALSTDEQKELDILLKLYPALPPDLEDPVTRAMLTWERESQERRARLKGLAPRT